MNTHPLQRYERHPELRLRRSTSGGAAFLPAVAMTVELDAEAFTTLALLTGAQTARDLRGPLMKLLGHNVTLAEVDILLRDLAGLGCVRPAPASDRGGTGILPVDRPLGATGRMPVPLVGDPDQPPPPESVHLQLNNVCNLRCPSCYVSLQSQDTGSLSLDRLLELIDEWAEMGVFQLALGGGEPLMSPKFAPVARRARERGLVPNVTTNGWLISMDLLDEIAGSIGEVRLSLNDVASANIPLLSERAALMRERGIRFGFNLIVTRPNLDRLADWLKWACDLGAATVNLIRPKPAPGNDAWYARNALAPTDTLRLAHLLAEVRPLFEQTALAVDCAFSFLFFGRPASELRDLRVAGCPMGDRFAVVTWNGDVLPCSHLHGEEFIAGNVRDDSFCAIWRQGEVFSRLRRELREVHGHCGSCAHNPHCKGCRAVVQQKTGDWLAADNECGLAPTVAGYAAGTA